MMVAYFVDAKVNYQTQSKKNVATKRMKSHVNYVISMHVMQVSFHTIVSSVTFAMKEIQTETVHWPSKEHQVHVEHIQQMISVL
uniref:CSON013461 protein n=1 Tax=Culicoides sonorensis TaxID=179676 RepID=A0A336M8W1_CULSO